MKNINKPKFYSILFFSFLLIAFGFSIFFHHDTDKNHIYTIGTTYEIKGKSRSSSKRLLFTYLLDNKLNDAESQFSNDSLEYYEPNIGKRFLVKMNNKEWVNRVFSTYKLYINIPVPDSIKSAPQEGWKDMPDWAKK